jgi:hypothetical protein
MEHTTKLPTHIAQSPTVDIFNSHLAQDFVNTNLFQINLFVFILKIKDIKKKVIQKWKYNNIDSPVSAEIHQNFANFSFCKINCYKYPWDNHM